LNKIWAKLYFTIVLDFVSSQNEAFSTKFLAQKTEIFRHEKEFWTKKFWRKKCSTGKGQK